MDSRLRSKMWRLKQKEHLGRDLFNKREAQRMRISRNQKKERSTGHGQRRKIVSKVYKRSRSEPKHTSFVKLSRNPQWKHANPPPSQPQADHLEGKHLASPSSPKLPVRLEDDIYISTGRQVHFKEAGVTQRHLVFKHPFTCMIAGPTSSGKTVFTTRLIEHRDEMIEPKIEEIIWCYGIQSPQLAKLKEMFPGILKLHKGLPDLVKLETLSSDTNRLLVLDDLMNETKGNTVANLFSKGAHHLNISVIYVVQNVFNQNKEMRNIFLNSQYKVLFNNPSDVNQLTYMNTRMFPGDKNFLKDVMKSVAQKPHPYITLDVHPKTPEDLRVRSHVFPSEENNVYLPQ